MGIPELEGRAAALVFIRARSRKQAMDWSLVLLSQELESTVTREETGWGLRVPASEATRARGVLAVYQRENRRWFSLRRPEPGTFAWDPVVLGWAAVLIGFQLLQGASGHGWDTRGCMHNAAVDAGQYWRLITAVTLHVDARHLTANLLIGGLVLGLAMGARGVGWTLLGSLLGGMAGNALGWLVYDQAHRGVGASGMVMAALGLLATASVAGRERSPAARFWLGRAIVGAVLLFVLLGLDPTADVVAHAGGFVAGLILGLVLLRLRGTWWQSDRCDRLAGCVAAATILVGWWLALR